MKNIAAILAVVATAVPAVVAQFPAGFPPCGVTCITNMLGQAAALGCAGADPKCLCQNQNFIYGIRDCSYQFCQNDTAAGSIISYGTEYCKQAGVTIPTETGPAGGNGGGGGNGGSGASSVAAPTGTNAGGSNGVASSVPVTTAAIVSTISSGGSVITSTIGSTTLYSVVGGGAGGTGGQGGAVPISTSSFTTVITTGGSTITSTGASTILGSASVTTSAIVSTIVSDGSTRVTTAGSSTITSTRPTSSTSSGLAPQKTAAPAGLLAAAGLAALLL